MYTLTTIVVINAANNNTISISPITLTLYTLNGFFDRHIALLTNIKPKHIRNINKQFNIFGVIKKFNYPQHFIFKHAKTFFFSSFLTFISYSHINDYSIC